MVWNVVFCDCWREVCHLTFDIDTRERMRSFLLRIGAWYGRKALPKTFPNMSKPMASHPGYGGEYSPVS
jgi:hypothetical protein